MKTKKEDGLIDFYKHIPKGMLQQYHNPHYKDHYITVPFYAILAGGTGAGKTQTLMNIIKKMNGTFEKLILCLKNADEPLYKWLKSKIPPQMLEVYEGGIVPDVDKYREEKGQMLVIFDDLVNMKNQKPIEEWYVRGRKIAGGCSMIYLTQSWFKTPKLVRIQCNHIFLKRLTSNRDLNMVISEYGLLGIKQQITQMYKDITSGSKVPFLLIRTDAEPDQRFSENFTNWIQVEDGI